MQLPEKTLGAPLSSSGLVKGLFAEVLAGRCFAAPRSSSRNNNVTFELSSRLTTMSGIGIKNTGGATKKNNKNCGEKEKRRHHRGGPVCELTDHMLDSFIVRRIPDMEIIFTTETSFHISFFFFCYEHTVFSASDDRLFSETGQDPCGKCPTRTLSPHEKLFSLLQCSVGRFLHLLKANRMTPSPGM